MTEIFHSVEDIFILVLRYCILLVEFVGVCVLIRSIVRAVIGLFKKQTHLRLELAEGIALALEFKMGGELLRTVIVQDWKELVIVGVIILLRAALTFLIQWEIHIEKKNGVLQESEQESIEIFK